jgi:hypothetical protein
MAGDKLLAFSTGIEDAATQRAVRALERALNAANSAISALQSAGGGSGVPTTRLVNTVAPLGGGGSLAADLTLTVSAFGSGVSGVVPASGGGTVNFLRADGSWAAPGSSGVPTSRLINTTAPITGGGDLTADRTLALAANGITNALFRQGAGTSLVGVTGGATANVADIVATADNQIPIRSAGSLAFFDFATIVASLANRGHYGDGADGALVFDGSATVTLLADNATLAPSANVYTLTRDIFATTISISNGVTIKSAGFFVFAKTSVTGAGTATIACDGGAGGIGTTVGGTAGAAAFANGRYNSSGVVGGAGSTTGAGTAGSVASSQLSPAKNSAISAVGGNGNAPHGGGGGGNGGTGTGGQGGGSTANPANSGGDRNWVAIINGHGTAAGSAFNMWGAGGAGGGGQTSLGGGGGGAPGAYVGLFTPVVLGALLLRAAGGNGGNGNAGGNTGGGGGGGGGYVVYDVIVGASLITTSVVGGNGGVKGGTGANGGNGAAGEIIIL